MQHKPVALQVERILDEKAGGEVEVIVQMESEASTLERLERTAGAALERRRFSLSPRDLLPPPHQKKVSKQDKVKTTSTRALLDQATAETLTLARIQKMGLATLHPLLQSGIVRAALDRMSEPARKSAPTREAVSRFWTSRSVALRLERDELVRLPDEVDNIKAIHINRRLSLHGPGDAAGPPREGGHPRLHLGPRAHQGAGGLGSLWRSGQGRDHRPPRYWRRRLPPRP